MSERCFTQPFVAVAALVEQDQKILFVKLANGQSQGLWDLPAGWVDLGEKIVTACVRETKEETGLDFIPTAFVGVYSYVKKSKLHIGTVIQPIAFAFRGTHTGKLFCDGSEIIEFGWFTLSEILAMNEHTLRSLNSKQIASDYFSGKSYPLSLVRHEVQA